MIRVNIHEAKTHFSEYLAKAASGKTIIVCKRNVPIAEIRALPGGSKRKRQIGFDKGRISISKKFFEPLPAELLGYFNGRKG